METAANPYMTELGDRETAASRLNLAQSFNGLGCICGPLVGGLLLFSEKGEANISYPYIADGGSCADSGTGLFPYQTSGDCSYRQCGEWKDS